MIVNIILLLIIFLLLWRIFKFDKYTKINFYQDIINFCTWSMEKLERIRNQVYLKIQKEKNAEKSTN